MKKQTLTIFFAAFSSVISIPLLAQTGEHESPTKMMAQEEDPWGRKTRRRSEFAGDETFLRLLDDQQIRDLLKKMDIVDAAQKKKYECPPRNNAGKVQAFCQEKQFANWSFSEAICREGSLDPAEAQRQQRVEAKFRAIKTKALRKVQANFGYNPLGPEGQKIYDTDRLKWLKAFEAYHKEIERESQEYFESYKAFASTMADKLSQRVKSMPQLNGRDEKAARLKSVQVVSFGDFVSDLRKEADQELKTYSKGEREDITAKWVYDLFMQCGLDGSVQGGLYDPTTNKFTPCPGSLLYGYEISDHSKEFSEFLSKVPFVDKYKYANVQWEYLAHLTGHEFGHSVDSYKFEKDYTSLKACVSDRFGLPTSDRVFREIIGDYYGIEALTVLLESVPKEQAYKILERYYRNICSAKEDNHGHLDGATRLNQVIAKHPKLRKLMGCQPEIPACTLEGPYPANK